MVRSMEGKRPEYFEAILQLRDIPPGVYQLACQEIARARIYLAKLEELKNGYDLYLADSRFTKALGKRLQQEFGGHYLVTASLYGQRDGKKLYRLTVLYRGIPFKKGDTVEYRGNKYRVLSLGREIILQNPTAGEKVHLKYKEAEKVKKI